MATISFSESALEKIEKHSKYIGARNEHDDDSLIPMLVWSHRMYSIRNGETIELGPLLYLSAVRLDDISKEQCLVIKLLGENLLAIRPKEKFISGVHQIGLVDGKFTLHTREKH